MSFCHVKILEYFPWQKYIVVAMAELFGTHPSANYLGITSLDQANGAWQRNFMDHDIFSVLSIVFFNLLLVSFFIALFSTQSWMLYMYLPWLITLRNMAIFELFCFLCYYSNMWQFVWSKVGNFYKNSMANLNMHLPWQFWIILFFVLLFSNMAIFLVKNTRAKIEYSLFAIAILINFFAALHILHNLFFHKAWQNW